MRIAAFNVENLFQRAKVFNDPEPAAHRDVLDALSELGKLLELPTYSSADKARILSLLEVLKIKRSDEGPYVRLQRIRGQLLRRPKDKRKPVEVVASGRDKWVGWVELKTEAVNARAMENSARVLKDSEADVLALVEVESRPTFLSFQKLLYTDRGHAAPFAHVMVIDGNDARGIDVGLASRVGFPIGLMRSHVDIPSGGKSVFSRDCPVYEVTTPAGSRLLVLPNHLKSKFGGDQGASDQRRKAQASAIAEIYNELRNAGEEHIAVLGDLNDTPASDPLQPLLANTDLKEVSDHPRFIDFEFKGPTGQRGIGTYKLGNDRDKIDFILLSPALFDRVTKGGIFRKGAWPGSRPSRWNTYAELEKVEHAASDHHLIWVDVDL